MRPQRKCLPALARLQPLSGVPPPWPIPKRSRHRQVAAAENNLLAGFARGFALKLLHLTQLLHNADRPVADLLGPCGLAHPAEQVLCRLGIVYSEALDRARIRNERLPVLRIELLQLAEVLDDRPQGELVACKKASGLLQRRELAKRVELIEQEQGPVGRG